jgi:hypothetical protein
VLPIKFPYVNVLCANHRVLAIKDMNYIFLLKHLDHGFQSHTRHGRLCLLRTCVLLCVGNDLETGWSSIQGVIISVLGIIFFSFIYRTGMNSSPLLVLPVPCLLNKPWTIDGDDCGAISGMNEWQGKPKYSEKPCRSVALSITDSTWLGPGSNPEGGNSGKPATNCLSYGTAVCGIKIQKEASKARQRLYSRNKTNKQTPWPLVRERTIPTDRPPLFDEI